MKKSLLFILAGTMSVVASVANASQASDAQVAVLGHNTGASPFISNVDVAVTPATNLKSIQFTVARKTGSVTRPLSATYAVSHLQERGKYDVVTGAATVPVFGLYAAFDNSVELTFLFQDGSSKKSTTAITTAAYDDGGCDFNNPTVLQARTSSTELSYDYVLVTSQCNNNSPTIIDTDGAIRWVGTADVSSYTATFYDNAVYLGDGPRLLRIEMDGTVTLIADYSDRGVVQLHHNIDIGRNGLILDLDTVDYVETVNFEVNPTTGEVLKTWNFANIIGNAMTAGGDDPSQFIIKAKSDYSPTSPEDWWHNNAATYRRSDNTLLVSSRENFTIAVDYDTKAIKWIFGDQTKKWHQFPSLAQYALNAAPGTLTPIGQHTLSITKDNNLLLMDNGQESSHQMPAGIHRGYSAPRKYVLDLEAMIATAVWRYENNQSVTTPFCSGVYEDAPMNYVVDYAVVGGLNANTKAQVFGLTPNDEVAFKYQYASGPCNVAYRSLPIHLEDAHFPTSDVQLANISSRSFVGNGDNATIAGFIVSGNASKPLIVRGLGPSLKANHIPVTGRLDNPTLALYDSNGLEIDHNDNYKERSDSEKALLAQANLTPGDDREAAMAGELPPGAYTLALRGSGDTTGIGLIEVYDVDTATDAKLANLSTRAYVSTGDNVLIGGLLLRGNAIKRVFFRGIGPELQEAGLENALPDTNLEVMDANGTMIASNDDWKNANNIAEMQQTGLQPTNDQEAAILMPMLAGDYTVILSGKGASGTALLEVYQLD